MMGKWDVNFKSGTAMKTDPIGYLAAATGHFFSPCTTLLEGRPRIPSAVYEEGTLAFLAG